MRLHSYVIEHDLGFAPNPFYGVCSLACCKPKIRKYAELGDYVVGLGGARAQLTEHLCYWMRVDEIITFDDYWKDRRFRRKRPYMAGSTHMRYGDNIYHIDPGNGEYVQVDSFHSLPNGVLSTPDLERDTGSTDKVLLGREFGFFGRSGIPLPDELKFVVVKRRGHKNRCFSPQQVEAIVSWITSNPARGYRDEPALWHSLPTSPGATLGKRRRRGAI